MKGEREGGREGEREREGGKTICRITILQSQRIWTMRNIVI